ncbi:MAG: hypothetical protein GX259_00620 [Bacteroidales bacterium]|nr:hypothetical protein [Bacteroidales bacterium]
MKKHIYFLIIITAMFSCCKNKDYNYLDLVKEKEIILPFDETGAYYPDYAKYVVIDNVETIIVCFENIKLAFYDLNKKEKYHEIKLNYNTLYDYKYINKDSIFLFYVNQFRLDCYKDSGLLVLIDFDGNEKRKYSFNLDDEWRNANENMFSKTAFQPHLLANNIEIFNNNIFFFLKRWEPYNIGTDSFFMYKSPIIARYDINTQKLKPSKKLWYPNIEKGIYFPSDFNIMNYCIAADGNPLIRLYYSSNLYKWDYKKDSIIEYSLKSRVIDSILPIEYPTSYSDNNIDAMYLSLTYDKYREMYYSILLLSPDKYGIGAWLFIVADKNLNYISETFAPEMSNFSPIITEKYIINVTPNDDKSFKVCFFKPVLTNIKYDEHLQSIKDSLQNRKKKYEDRLCSIEGNYNNTKARDIKNYFDKIIKIKENNFTVLSLFADEGCPPCREELLAFIGYNNNVLRKTPFYLIISGNDENEIKKTVTYYNLLNLTDRLYIDIKGDLKLFNKFGIKNPRLTIVEQGNIISDTIYYPYNIKETLIPNMLKSLNLEIKE